MLNANADLNKQVKDLEETGQVYQKPNIETPAMTPEEAAIQGAAYTMKNQDAIAKGLMPSIPGSNPLLDSGNQSPQPTKPTQPILPLPPGAARPFTY